jgi:hypothetical protein
MAEMAQKVAYQLGQSCFDFFCDITSLRKGSPGTVVKLLPCDHEVMCSSPGNRLLQKCRERLCT